MIISLKAIYELFNFSSGLIDETIKVFRDENNLELSREEANAYLNSLSGLFLAFRNEGVGDYERRVGAETPTPYMPMT